MKIIKWEIELYVCACNCYFLICNFKHPVRLSYPHSINNTSDSLDRFCTYLMYWPWQTSVCLPAHWRLDFYTDPGRHLSVGHFIGDLGFEFRSVRRAAVGMDGSQGSPGGGLAVGDPGLEAVTFPLTHGIHILHLLQHLLDHRLENKHPQMISFT